MDYAPIRSWLRLPPGPWPPDHYALLGLAPDEAHPLRVEARVLELMGALRHRQLRHPELVTEGMNRLAEALVCLADPAERAAYDAARGIAPPPKAPAAGGPPAARPARGRRADPAPTVVPESESAYDLDEGDSLGDNADATLVLDLSALPDEEGKGFSVVEADRTAPPAAEAAPAEIVEARVASAPVAAGAESRRWVYRRLAVVRRCLRGWDALGPYFADPEDPLDRPAAAFGLLQAAFDLRPEWAELHGLIGEPGRRGGLAFALVRQPLPTAALRDLLLDQHVRVAVDWRRGRWCLEEERERLRALARGGRSIGRRRVLRPLRRWIERKPEALALAAAALALAIALWRDWRGH